MQECLNRTSQAIWSSCSTEVVLHRHSQIIQDRFAPWTDTIYDKLSYTKRIINHANWQCNTGSHISRYKLLGCGPHFELHIFRKRLDVWVGYLNPS